MRVEGFLCLCVGWDSWRMCVCGYVRGWENLKVSATVSGRVCSRTSG